MHLPVQSGSERIVRMMRRSHSVDQIRSQLAALRQQRHEIAMTTDIIVGFPGETEADFEETLGLIAELRLASIYAFIYSERPGTAAARIDDDVPIAVKKARLRRLQTLQDGITADWMASHEGQEVEVLFEGMSPYRLANERAKGLTRPNGGPPQLVGRTPQNVKVHVASTDPKAILTWPGRLGRVQLKRVGRHSLSGELVALK